MNVKTVEVFSQRIFCLWNHMALTIATPMNTATRAIVNLKRASSIPLLVLKDDSADPNKVVP